MWPLYVFHGAIVFPILVVTLGGARLIRVPQLLILLLLNGVEGSSW
jgi:hypothetical protein